VEAGVDLDGTEHAAVVLELVVVLDVLRVEALGARSVPVRVCKRGE
jgi:hypothetical protein